jgi:putative transposase
VVATIDCASRAVLSWRLSNLERVVLSALEEALARFGKPEIFNTDQGSQFTSATFTGTLVAAEMLSFGIVGIERWL